MAFWWLSRLLGGASPEDVQGARLDDPDPRIVNGPSDPAVFFRALPLLLPAGVVYFEGPDENLQPWLAGQAMPEPLKIAFGTVWPTPTGYHVPLNDALMTEAAAIVDRHGIAIPSTHLHVHDGARVVLEWYDAFGSDPMWIRSDVPGERLEAFVAQLMSGPAMKTDVRAPEPLPRTGRLLTPLALRVTGTIIGVIPLIALVTGSFWESDRAPWIRIVQAVAQIWLAVALFRLASTRTRAHASAKDALDS